MKKVFTIVCLVLAISGETQLARHRRYDKLMAETVMNIWKDSFALDGKPAKWTYDMGVILKGFEGLWLSTGDVKYYNYIQQQMDVFVQNDGSIRRTDLMNIILTISIMANFFYCYIVLH